MTVGFLHGAGAETLIFVTGTSGKEAHICHVYLNSVQQMVSGELAGEGLQTGFSRHGLPPQRAPLDTVYRLREDLNSVQRMVSGGYCEGLFPDTVCWTRLRNTWIWSPGRKPKSAVYTQKTKINRCLGIRC